MCCKRWPIGRSRPAVAVVTSDPFARELAARFQFRRHCRRQLRRNQRHRDGNSGLQRAGSEQHAGGSCGYSPDRERGTARDRRLRAARWRGAGARCSWAWHERSVAISGRFVSAALRQRQLFATPRRGEGDGHALCCDRTAGHCARCGSSRRSLANSPGQRRKAIAEAGAKLGSLPVACRIFPGRQLRWKQVRIRASLRMPQVLGMKRLQALDFEIRVSSHAYRIEHRQARGWGSSHSPDRGQRRSPRRRITEFDDCWRRREARGCAFRMATSWW